MYDPWLENERRGPGVSGLLLAFAGGAVLGAGAALLLAPVPGRELRESLGFAERGRRWAADADEDLDGFAELEDALDEQD